ncbi:MAG: hypothetical protein WCY80_02315 [Candidatus Izemoplasmatales bacterium]
MNVIDWLLKENVSCKYLVNKYLLEKSDSEINHLKSRITEEGFGLILMNKQDLKTHLWGEGVYSPKYISTHYTLLELCQLGACLQQPNIIEAIKVLFKEMWKARGEVKSYRHQDLCVVAMMVRIACTAKFNDFRLREMIDFILEHQMDDGGWNCAWERLPKPKQSSLHTTLSVLDAFNAYSKNEYIYRINEINQVIPQASEYILSKRMFRSVKTNEVIHKDMLVFPFPYGWKYDILRALTVMVDLEIPYDERMEESLDILISRLDEYGRIKANRKQGGLHHIQYTKTNHICPFNSLRVLKVLKTYRNKQYQNYLSKEIS